MSASSTPEQATTARIAGWDVAVRVLHWALAGAVVFNLVRDDGDELHRTLGYWAVGFVVARLIWSTLSSGRGRWRALRPSPRATLRYARALAHGSAPRHDGHDPLAVWMVWLLWTLVLLLGLTGWLSRTDAFWGDESMQDLHAWLANALLIAVVAHVVAVAAMSWRWGVNLVAGMVFGHAPESKLPDQ